MHLTSFRAPATRHSRICGTWATFLLDEDGTIARRRPRSERASDAEREAVVERLRAHAVAGRVDVEELAARAEQTYQAKTIGQLADVLGDLPDRREFVAERARPRLRPWRLPAIGLACSAGTTVAVAHFDGGFRGPVDGVAAVPFWATLALAAVLAARALGTRLRENAPARTPRST